MKKTTRKFVDDAIVRSLKKAMRSEVEKEYKKRDIVVAQLVLNKLLQDCRIEIIPNRVEENAQFRKNKDAK